MFDLRIIILLFCLHGTGGGGNGRGEHVSQRSPGWPPTCHNLPASASHMLGCKRYELSIAQDVRDLESPELEC